MSSSSSSSSSGSSGSSSSSSSSGGKRRNKTGKKPKVTIITMGAPMVSGEGAGKAPVAAPLDLYSKVEPLLHTAKFALNFNAAPATLKAQPGGGTTLNFILNKALLSHPEDARITPKNMFVARAVVQLNTAAPGPFLATLSVPALENESHANMASKSEDAPYGYLSVPLESNNCTGEIRRVVTANQLAYMKDFPGQLAGSFGKSIFQLSALENVGYVNKTSYTTRVYNQLNAATPLDMSQADKHGIISGDYAKLKAAAEIADTRVASQLALTHVSKELALTLETVKVDSIGLDGKATQVQKSFADTHLASSDYLKYAHLGALPGGVSAAKRELSTDPIMNINGSVTLYYLPTDASNVANIKL